MTTENNIFFFIPDSDCGVLKKKSDEMEMSWLGLVEICIFFFNREIVLTIH